MEGNGNVTTLQRNHFLALRIPVNPQFTGIYCFALFRTFEPILNTHGDIVSRPLAIINTYL